MLTLSIPSSLQQSYAAIIMCQQLNLIQHKYTRQIIPSHITFTSNETYASIWCNYYNHLTQPFERV